MVSCLMGDSTALASAIVRCCLMFISREGVLTKVALIAIAIGIIFSGISGILNSKEKE